MTDTDSTYGPNDKLLHDINDAAAGDALGRLLDHLLKDPGMRRSADNFEFDLWKGGSHHAPPRKGLFCVRTVRKFIEYLAHAVPVPMHWGREIL